MAMNLRLGNLLLVLAILLLCQEECVSYTVNSEVTRYKVEGVSENLLENKFLKYMYKHMHQPSFKPCYSHSVGVIGICELFCKPPPII